MKPNMTLRDAINAADHLRRTVSTAIAAFELDTGLVVDSIDLTHEERLTGRRRTVQVQTRITMPL
jgi:hypothetical protein